MQISSRRPGVFDADLHVLIPTDIRQLIDDEAARRRCRMGEMVRRLLLAGIVAEGLTLPEPAQA